MYDLEKAVRALGPQFNSAAPHRVGAVESAFRTLEVRGASDTQWESLIARIRANSLTPDGEAAPTDDFRAKLLALLS